MPHSYYKYLGRFAGLSLLGFAVALIEPATAANLNLGWNGSTDAGVTGYKLSYGTTSGHYTTSINTGNSTSATVTSLAPGATYYFVVAAYDSIGLQSVSSNEVSLSVPNNIPPTVSLTSPQSAATFQASSPISLAATASDSDGTVVKVEFYQDANKIGQSTSSPYSAVWTNPPSGNFTMTALAYDDSGAAVRSAGVPIQVLGSTSSSPTPSPSPTPTRHSHKIKAVAMTPIIKGGDTARIRVISSDVDTTQPTVVNYSLGGTATAGVNYAAASITGQVTIPAGSRVATLALPTLLAQGGNNKTAVVTVLPGDNYTPARSTAVVRIVNR